MKPSAAGVATIFRDSGMLSDFQIDEHYEIALLDHLPSYGLRIKSVDWSIAKFYSAITFRHSAADFWEVYRASRSAV
ncbi:hypothetical protein, partial [Deinococcus saxicola]|uniref:hypothetical protein n=1 Tax=Deinococcus saxicola TaxID=249406 RepID=UPI0039EEB9C1